jgi:hypothetical protein
VRTFFIPTPVFFDVPSRYLWLDFWVPARCGSGGGLEHTGQHFTGGEQATAMLPDTLDDGVGTVRVEVADRVFDQMDAVVAQDQAAGRAIDTDFRDHTVKNDLAVAQQFQKKIRVGIREHVNGLLLEDDLRIAAEVPGQIDLAIWNGEVVREEGTLTFFCPEVPARQWGGYWMNSGSVSRWASVEATIGMPCRTAKAVRRRRFEMIVSAPGT